MSQFLRPGTFLLKFLRYPQKFALIMGLLVIPIMMAIGLLQSETVPRIGFTRQELAGSQYIQQLGALYDQIQQSNQSSDDPRGAAYQQAQTDLNAAVTTLRSDATFNRLFQADQHLDGLTQQVKRLSDPNMMSSPAALQQAHLDVMAATSSEIRRVADASNLILDPELDTYYLMSIAVGETTERVELLARAVPLASSRRAPGGVAAQRALVTGGQLENNRAETERSIDVAVSGDARLQQILSEPGNTTSAAVLTIVDTLQEIGTGAEPPTDVKQRSQAAYDASIELWRTALGALDTRLQTRIDQLQEKNTMALVVAGIILLGTMYLLIAFYSSTMQAVRTLDDASKQALTGATVSLDTRDELGEVVSSFNRVVGELARENAERIASDAERAQLQETIIAAQAVAIEELSVPIIRLSDGVVFLPLLGTVDGQRASQILQTLLEGVSKQRASLALLDLTGIRNLDTFAVRALLDAMTGARLLGADVALVGVRADVALTITRLGVDLGEFECFASLQEALQKYLGLGIANGQPMLASVKRN